MTLLDWTLLGFCIYQQVFYSYQMQKLTNKIMSGSYGAYVGATKEELPKKIQLPDAPEDLRVLQEFSLT